MDVDIANVTRIAQLPADMFACESLALTPEEYFRFGER